MGANDTRVVVVTKDSSFFSKIRQPLAKDGLFSLVINVTTVMDAENKLSAVKPNVLLIDTDSGAIGTAAQIENLTKKYVVFVIFTGSAHTRATPYQSPNAREFIIKPLVGAPQTFVNSVVTRARPAVIKNNLTTGGASALAMRDITNIATADTKVVLVASSTGGTDAFEKVISTMPADCPPILIVQHMPSGFTKLFAERLNNYYPMNIKEAQTNDYVKTGQILMAPADMHMSLAKQGEKLAVKCFIGEKVHAVMPAADVLFESAAPILKHNAVGVVLTGMGSDGAKGLLLLKKSGARTICQDEATSVVYGMPRAAFQLGAVDYKLPLNDIGDRIMKLARG